jgi:pimeloyl-ACP methyl ester carboxylesterase
MPECELSDGATLHYETWGDLAAPPVVLLHGFTSSHRMWHAHVDELAEDYFVVAPDLRGHGASSSPEDLSTYTMERYALDVRELLTSLGIDLCGLVGCSFGGMIALNVAVTWPELIAALVISDASPAYERPDYDDRFRKREAGLRETEELARKLGMVGLGKRLAANMTDSFLAEGVRNRWARLDLNGFLGAARVRRERPDITHLLNSRLTMPVLLCDGEDDPVFCALDVMARELPEARVVSVKGAGHGLPSTAPETFARVLGEFLADVERGEPVAGRFVV